MLTLGWSDGCSFIPVDFFLLSSAKAENRLCGMQDSLDKRTHGFKRRQEALLQKPAAVECLLKKALAAGFQADFVLMDSWFTQAPLLRVLTSMGQKVIGMVKPLKQRYLYEGQSFRLQELYRFIRMKKHKDILGSILVTTAYGLPIKLVFVRNRNKRREWLAIASTGITLDEAEIVRIYGIRWKIETFFKCTKSYLKLGTEFQGRSFDMLISHTTIVFARYLLLEWEQRKAKDVRSIGGLFYVCCDEIKDIDLKTAMQ